MNLDKFHFQLHLQRGSVAINPIKHWDWIAPWDLETDKFCCCLCPGGVGGSLTPLTLDRPTPFPSFTFLSWVAELFLVKKLYRRNVGNIDIFHFTCNRRVFLHSRTFKWVKSLKNGNSSWSGQDLRYGANGRPRTSCGCGKATQLWTPL